MKIALAAASDSDRIDDDLLLVRGEISDASLRAMRTGEITQTVKNREVPTRVHRGDVVWIEPRALLDVGETYTVVRTRTAATQSFVVVSPTMPVLAPLWPASSAIATNLIVLCADTPWPESLVAMGGEDSWSIRPGVLDAPRAGCITLERSCLSSAPVLPVAIADAQGAIVALVDPSERAPVASASACVDHRSSVGPICFEVQDDRAILSRGAEVAVVSARMGETILGGVVENESLVLRGLIPDHPFGLTLDVIGGSGERQHIAVEGKTLPARPHVIVNEVLADPDGPEPASEWVELVNDSARSERLEGWTLEDGGGMTPLPDVTIDPGQIAVIVGADAPASLLASIPSSAIKIVVPRVGKSGLSNAGESLALHDASGWVSSRFPSAPHPKNGRSVQRRTLSTQDDDSDGFVLATPTPGAIETLP